MTVTTSPYLNQNPPSHRDTHPTSQGGEWNQFAEVKAIQLAWHIAEHGKRAVLYTDSGMVFKCPSGVVAAIEDKEISKMNLPANTRAHILGEEFLKNLRPAAQLTRAETHSGSASTGGTSPEGLKTRLRERGKQGVASQFARAGEGDGERSPYELGAVWELCSGCPGGGQPPASTKQQPSVNKELLKRARQHVKEAIKEKKIFSVQGPYPVMRKLLRARGWVEGKFSTTIKKQEDGSGEEQWEAALHPEPRSASCWTQCWVKILEEEEEEEKEQEEVPWYAEDPDGIQDIMSSMVRDRMPTFIWMSRGSAVSYWQLQDHQMVHHFKGTGAFTTKHKLVDFVVRFMEEIHKKISKMKLRGSAISYWQLQDHQMVHHFNGTGAFTTKVRLCVNLQNLPSFYQADPTTFFPRCYQLGDEDEHQAFIEDFRLTAAHSLLKLAVEKIGIVPGVMESPGLLLHEYYRVVKCVRGEMSSRHLCNVSIQKQWRQAAGSKLPCGLIWSSHQLQQVGHTEAWENVIVPGMKEAVVATLHSCRELVRYRKGSFDLYRADFMFGEDCQPWLLEINASPTMVPCSAVTRQLCAAVQRDILRVVLDHRGIPGCSTGAFELIHKEPIVPVPPCLGLKLLVEGYSLMKPQLQKQQPRTNSPPPCLLSARWCPSHWW
ncbi:tubulin tyrosine ligase 3-like [Pezoporus wallicus]|uniref:tubulin tyrosine ligase 3-like n=1 Tax=Pezoporus wallicus TaxID=35540 RepID=UPI00254B2134|nr:tubulin tyrosine ligase 3-like [Pezoporus wallicus]